MKRRKHNNSFNKKVNNSLLVIEKVILQGPVVEGPISANPGLTP